MKSIIFSPTVILILSNTIHMAVATNNNNLNKNNPSTIYEVTVEVFNGAPNKGTCQTPVWVGIHDGRFDVYDRDVKASAALERIAEDGNAQPLVDDFARAPGGAIDGVVGSAPICPNDDADIKFIVNVRKGTPLYISYTSMVLPSNDAFIANGNPMAHLMFNKYGNFDFEAFTVQGSEVLDAGTERNDEIRRNTAFFGQMQPDTGVDERGVVTLHEGFQPPSRGGILADARFTNADFTKPRYNMITVDAYAKKVSHKARALLRGRYVHPVVHTRARGSVALRFLPNGNIAFRVTLSNIDKVLLGKLHVDVAEEDEQALAVKLFHGSDLRSTKKHGVWMAKGVISSSRLLNGELERLWYYVLNGKAYVSVLTKDYPHGEIRGNFV